MLSNSSFYSETPLIRRKGRPTLQGNGGMPQGAVGKADWGMIRSEATAPSGARPGRVFCPQNTERRKGRPTLQGNGGMPQGAVGKADWGIKKMTASHQLTVTSSDQSNL